MAILIPILVAIAALLVGSAVHYLVARYLGAWVGWLALLLAVAVIIDMGMNPGFTGIDYTTLLGMKRDGYAELGELVLATVRGAPSLLGGLIGRWRGAAVRRRET